MISARAFLRLLPANQDAVHGELARVLDAHSEPNLRKAFVVVQASGHRFRRLPSRTPSSE